MYAGYDVSDFVDLRRSRAPIGSAPLVDPASCDAGQTYPFDGANRESECVADVVGRRSPRRSGSSPGKIASPAASADVHPSGRRLLRSTDRKSRPTRPPSRAPVPVRVIHLEEQPAIPIDDEHVVIAVGAAADVATLDVVRCRLGFGGIG